MTQEEQEISASKLYHWVSSRELLLWNSVGGATLCNYPESPGANLHGCLSLARSLSLCLVAPCVCNMGGPEVVASVSPCTWGEMALLPSLCRHCTASSLHLTLFNLIYSCLLLTFSLIIQTFLFVKNNTTPPPPPPPEYQSYYHNIGTYEVFN